MSSVDELVEPMAKLKVGRKNNRRRKAPTVHSTTEAPPTATPITPAFTGTNGAASEKVKSKDKRKGKGKGNVKGKPLGEEILNKLKKIPPEKLVSYDLMKQSLEELGLTKVGKHLLAELTRVHDFNKCCRCESVFDSEDELVSHLRVEIKHVYGNILYRKNRRALLQRVKRRIPSASIPDVDIHNEDELTEEEKNAFNDLFELEGMTVGLQCTLFNLVYTGMCLRKLAHLLKDK